MIHMDMLDELKDIGFEIKLYTAGAMWMIEVKKDNIHVISADESIDCLVVDTYNKMYHNSGV